MDTKLIKELYDSLDKPRKHWNTRIPTDEEIKVLRDLYGKVALGDLYRALEISDKTLRKWIREYCHD